MNKIFNTSFELELRILLMLKALSPDALSLDRITAYDCISVYAMDFGITSENLHGNNIFGFAELSERRKICQDAIKSLFLKGLIILLPTEKGFTYKINENGIEIISQLKSDYSITYTYTVSDVNKLYLDVSDTALLDLINKKNIST